jgi:ferrous iron transport protein B
MQLLPKTGKLLYWSYGKTIEPAISPLGYDWKIGIAIISSFAAREVFVGTLATIYSVGGTDNEDTIKK